jgi:hypothetical protein
MSVMSITTQLGSRQLRLGAEQKPGRKGRAAGDQRGVQGLVGAAVHGVGARDRLRIPGRQQPEAAALREEGLQLGRGLADAQLAPFAIQFPAVLGALYASSRVAMRRSFERDIGGQV